MEERFKLPNQPWRVLEFYSGIGGMRYSIIRAGVNAEIVQAFDINDTANDVYEFNFHHRPYQGNIQSLSTDDLDRYRAHVWLLSPPCQPYTRQGLQKHSGDARASSFLKILELLSNTSQPPAMLFVENVVGFEASDTHSQMIEILAKADFVTQEFILSPLQFGVPYSRPRYFCLAKKKPLFFRYQQFNSQLIWTPSMLFGHEDNVVMNEVDPSKESCDELVQYCEPIERFLELKSCNQLEMENEIPFSTSVSNSDSKALGRCDEENGSSGNSLEQYLVPLNLIERWGSVMDIVYSNSKRCCCFTKSYYRYIKGTGSLLATSHPKKNCKESSLKEQSLRYFTPREVANLHSFPKGFNFPHNISLRQCYALLGNSLSVAVVAPLLQYLFSEPL